MPKDKLDSIVRARMARTGESYQTARNAVLAVDEEYVTGYARDLVGWRSAPDEFPDPALELTWIVRPGRSRSAHRAINDALLEHEPRLGVNPALAALGMDEGQGFVHGMHFSSEEGSDRPGSVVLPLERDPHWALELLAGMGRRPAHVFGVVAYAESARWFHRGAAGTVTIAATLGADGPQILSANRHGRQSVREVSEDGVGEHFGCLAGAMHEWVNAKELSPTRELMALLVKTAERDRLWALRREAVMRDPSFVPVQADLMRTYPQAVSGRTLGSSRLGLAMDVVDHVMHDIVHGLFQEPGEAIGHLVEKAAGRLDDAMLADAAHLLAYWVWGMSLKEVLDDEEVPADR